MCRARRRSDGWCRPPHRASRRPFTGQPLPSLDGPELAHGKPIDIGVFKITPYLVDHSAYDAYSLLIEAEGKRLLYSGDFRAHGP